MLKTTNKVLANYDSGNSMSWKDISLPDTLYPKSKIIEYVQSSNWLEKIKFINYEIVGKYHILDEFKLKSAATAIINPLSFDSQFEKFGDMVHISQFSTLGFIQMEAIFQQHPFADGNKRTGLNAGIKLVEYLANRELCYIEECDQIALAGSIIMYFEYDKLAVQRENLKFLYSMLINSHIW